MKVEIWSDLMCPFCYIGKRRFEKGLAGFAHKDSVEVVWHSFQINPSLTNQPDKDFYTYVAELKGQSREWSIKVHETLIQTAKEEGLDYQLDHAKITNSFDAHRLIQLAKKDHLTNEIEERFFRAYFTEGALMSDHPTLIRLGVEAGLKEDKIKKVLSSDQYAEEVQQDGETVKNLGATGVPFFLVNQKYAISGAQNLEVFLETLQKAYASWQEDRKNFIEVVNGPICTPEGKCD
ncbi:DsbA family oxidoreductase [Flavobacterium notoginsengisoli]